MAPALCRAARASPAILPGLSVTLTATPAPNHVFRSWSGDAAATRTRITFAMDSNKTITASFSLPMINITIQATAP
jgi:uncharacterized repeat protein (TIGR02543 family)